MISSHPAAIGEDRIPAVAARPRFGAVTLAREQSLDHEYKLRPRDTFQRHYRRKQAGRFDYMPAPQRLASGLGTLAYRVESEFFRDLIERQQRERRRILDSMLDIRLSPKSAPAIESATGTLQTEIVFEKATGIVDFTGRNVFSVFRGCRTQDVFHLA